jgi:protein SCO1/2
MAQAVWVRALAQWRRQALALLAVTLLATAAGAGPSLAEDAAVGGRFILGTHDGRVVTDQDFLGRHLLIFFGYTHCPDVCPTSLATLTTVMDLLGPQAEQVQPLFVSLDPKRDTAKLLAAYVSSFHPRLIGLTGSEEMIGRMAKAYRVSFQMVGSSAGDDYTIDHTASLFHMGPDGAYLGRFGASSTPEEIVAVLRPMLAD